MNSASACTVCGEAGHTPSRCAALHTPLKNGFWTGGNGGGGHGEEEEDDAIRVAPTLQNLVYQPLLQALLRVPVAVPL